MTDNERIAVLENRADTSDEVQAKILAHVKSIDENLNKYKGFMGAIWFAISCIGVFFSAFKFFHKGG